MAAVITLVIDNQRFDTRIDADNITKMIRKDMKGNPQLMIGRGEHMMKRYILQ